jgi:hypothetical protein
MQFVSYHDYMYGQTQLGAQWNTYNGVESVYQQTQNSGAGPYYRYVQAAKDVTAAGKQLPIYNTEYNLNWAFAKDCCRNDFTLSPIFNGIYVAGSLNAAYATPTVIGKLIFFAANRNPYFCLIGIPDANMDCAYNTTTPPQPYPEYFLYQLFFASNYLNLESGGHMVPLRPTPFNSGGQLIVTAFYNATQDAIVIINPTAASFPPVKVSLANSGFAGRSSATLYQIMNGRSISSSSVSLTSQGGTSYSATVSVGPYSVQAISIK